MGVRHKNWAIPGFLARYRLLSYIKFFPFPLDCEEAHSTTSIRYPYPSVSICAQGMNLSEALLMQYLTPLGDSVSFSNTWPRCVLPARLLTSVRTIPWVVSTSSTMDGSSIGLENAGQPQLLSNLVGGREQRLAGNDVHINTLLKLIPEFVSERILRTAFLRDIILLCRQFVTDGLFSGFLIIVGINAKGREQFDLFSGNMAIA